MAYEAHSPIHKLSSDLMNSVGSKQPKVENASTANALSRTLHLLLTGDAFHNPAQSGINSAMQRIGPILSEMNVFPVELDQRVGYEYSTFVIKSLRPIVNKDNPQEFQDINEQYHTYFGFL